MSGTSYQRVLSLIICFAMIFGMFSFPSTSAAGQEAPEIYNAGFEMDLVDGQAPGWSIVTSNKVSTVTSATYHAYSGDRSLHFNNSSTEEQLQVKSDYASVVPGGKYNAKAFVNVVSQTHSIGYEVHFFDSNNVKVGNATFINFAKGTLKLNEWNEINVPFEVPVGATQIEVRFNSGKVALTEAYFDDVSVEVVSLPGQEGPDEPEPTGEIVNPGFEMDLVDGQIPGWSLGPGTDGLFEVSMDRANSGERSLYYKDYSDKTGLRVFSDKFVITPGESYIAKAYVNVVQQTHNIVYQIYYYNENNDQVGVKQELFGELALGKNQWTEIRVMTDAPASAAYARVAFYSGDPSLTEAYFDDVSFESIPQEVPLDREYGAPVDLGPMVSVNLGQAAAIQQNSLGENEAYFMSNGKPGTFFVVDAETGRLKFSKVIPNTEATWAMTVGPDKNVYFSGTADRNLYRYVPEKKVVETVGVNPSDAWVWDLEATPDGKIYGSTYSKGGEGKVFEYDIETGQFRDYGTIMPGREYARGIAVDEKYIYVGLGTDYLHLFKVDRETGEKSEIPIEGYTGSAGGMVADVFVLNGKLLVSVSTVNMVVMDIETYEIEHTFQYSNMISEPYPADPNVIFYKFGTEFFKYDFSTNQSTQIELSFPLPDTVRVKDMQWIEMTSGPKAGETVLAIITQYGEFILYDPTDHWLSFIELEIDPQPVAIQALSTGEDGRLYLGGYQRGMSVYNPFTEQVELNISSFAQPEGIGFLNGHVYYGTYVAAVMYRFDPTKDVQLNVNPEMVYPFTNYQDRPFALTSGDGKLFVGTVPDYGILGGSLGIYDEATDQWMQYDQVVQNQSIIGLAYKDGYLYGGTSVWGGLGKDPVESAAKMFIWDVKNGKKIDEFTPDIPGIDEAPRMIGELSFGPDGHLWGAVDGTIFAMDVATKEIVKSKMIRPSLYNTSKWKPYRIAWSPDGMLYTTLSRTLMVIDPETLQYKVIDDKGLMNDMAIGIDGSIYYAPNAGTTMSVIAVPETDATLSAIIINGEPLKDFSPGVLEYAVSAPHASDVQVTAKQAEAAVVIEDTREAEGKTRIHVTAKDGKSTLDYVINWKESEQPEQPGQSGQSGQPVRPATPWKPAPTESDDPEKQIVNENSLKADQQQGKVQVDIAQGKKSVWLPASAAGIVGEDAILLASDEFAIEINPAVLKQLQQLVSKEELAQAHIIFSYEKITDVDMNDIVKRAKEVHKADVKEAGEAYTFNLSVLTGDGKQYELVVLDEPLILTMKFREDANRDLTAIYDVADDGTLAYIGGKLQGDWLTAEIHHFSKYAVLEYNKTFADVREDHWAAQTIKIMSAMLIANGVSDTQFAPDRSITRAEFAALIVRVLGLDAEGASPFADVTAGDWFASSVAAAYQAGIVNGRTETAFAPNQTISREEMAAMIVRAYNFKQDSAIQAKEAAAFADHGNIDSWARESVNTAYELGLVSGRGNNKFIPKGELSRAEAIQAIFNLMQK